jgi:hypothetical protein
MERDLEGQIQGQLRKISKNAISTENAGLSSGHLTSPVSVERRIAVSQTLAKHESISKITRGGSVAQVVERLPS